MPRTLVTGANGFVGQTLCDVLRKSGHSVIELTSKDTPAPSNALQCDIRDAEALGQLVKQAAPTHVVHLAAISNVATSFQQPLATWQTNVMGSLNLLEAVRQHAPRAFVLFVSSSEVYGATFKQGIALQEDAPCQPLNPYAASKLAAEAAFFEYFRQGMRGVVARPFNHIGARQSPDFVTASFARQIALIERGQQPPVLKVGNLEACRDFLDVRDVCSAYLRLLALEDGHSRCYNIASGTPRKIDSILQELLAKSACAITVEQDPERMRPSDIPSATGSSEALRQATGWQPAIDLGKTLEELLDYWRAEVKAAQ
ncbi:MAG: GDP-mannose 4,6-dehydratase [Azonexus sp.]|nr:GDP-mannose 4,6-dehydratase [Azonexus sp.]